MKLKLLIALLALFSTVPGGAEAPKLTLSGIEIDTGTMGKFTFVYPKFSAGDKNIKPEVRLEDGKATLTYLAESTPTVELAFDGNTLNGTMKTVAAGKLSWEMHIPISFADNGSFTFGADAEPTLFPRELPAKPHLAQLNGSRFVLTDNRSDCKLEINAAPGGFWQLQDNRAWKWKIFQLNFISDVYANRAGQTFKITFGAEQPKVAKIRVDRFGQPKALDFPGKITDEAELRADVAADRAYYDSLRPPATAPWGGLPGSCEKFGLKPTGFFRLDNVRERDVLVTPAGDLFFQLGVCAVSPCDDYTYVKGREQIYEWLPKYDSDYKTAFRGSWATDFSYYLANRIRKTGKPHLLEEWKTEQVERLRKWGFNSDGAFTGATPVNALKKFGRTPGLYKPRGIVGDICDPFDETIRKELDEKFSALAAEKDDPTIIGYFIANEQPYGDVTRKVPGFDGKVAAKRELVELLKGKYPDIAQFNTAWNLTAPDFEALNDLPLPVQTKAAWSDMEEYAERFFDAYFKLIAETFRKYDPNHLLIGARFLPANASVEAAVAACGKYCDVFSINYYTRSIDPAFLEKIHRIGGRPLLLSEWSYGTSEQGLAGGVVDTSDQVERGLAYRSYVEESAALPYVVGNQWFAYLDQALTGRFFQHYNGECMNIGLVNVADRPFKEFLAEVMKTNYQIYDIKLGEISPFVWRAANNSGNRAPRNLQIPRALPGHKVDAVKTPWPGRPSERLDGGCLVAGADSGGVGADFWLCWDEAGLYLYAEVVDPTPARNSRTGMGLWQSDCIELFIGGETPGKPGPLLFTDRQLMISADQPRGGCWFVNQPVQAKVSVAVIPSAAGYALEAAIPWEALNIRPETGLKFRFDLGLDNGDDGPRRLQQFMWSGIANNSADRSNWGTATLVD